MSKRLNICSGVKWEDVVGYSRAVRIGNTIEVAGTVAIENGEIVGLRDPYLQAKTAILKIERAIKEAGGELKNVVRTRIFVTDISVWEEIGKAHGEFFKEIKPVTTMVEVKALIDPLLMVEIEATAIL